MADPDKGMSNVVAETETVTVNIPEDEPQKKGFFQRIKERTSERAEEREKRRAEIRGIEKAAYEREENKQVAISASRKAQSRYASKSTGFLGSLGIGSQPVRTVGYATPRRKVTTYVKKGKHYVKKTHYTQPKMKQQTNIQQQSMPNLFSSSSPSNNKIPDLFGGSGNSKPNKIPDFDFLGSKRKGKGGMPKLF